MTEETNETNGILTLHQVKADPDDVEFEDDHFADIDDEYMDDIVIPMLTGSEIPDRAAKRLFRLNLDDHIITHHCDTDDESLRRKMHLVTDRVSEPEAKELKSSLMSLYKKKQPLVPLATKWGDNKYAILDEVHTAATFLKGYGSVVVYLSDVELNNPDRDLLINDMVD